VSAPRELSSQLEQARAVAIQVTFVAADKRHAALSERARRAGAGVVVGQVRLDDAVEHRDQCRPLAAKRLRRLREANSADVREGVEELRQWVPRDRAGRLRERSSGVDPSQGPLDLTAAREDRCALGRRDAGAAAVRPLDVALVEGRAGLEDASMSKLE
jgi:hypothetical protein